MTLLLLAACGPDLAPSHVLRIDAGAPEREGVALGAALPLTLRSRVEKSPSEAVWTSSDPSVGALDGSTLRALSPGETTVSVEATVGGQRFRTERRFAVVEPHSVDWSLLGNTPVEGEPVLLTGFTTTFVVTATDGAGERLYVTGLPLDLPEEVRIEPGRNADSMLVRVRVRDSTPPRLPIPVSVVDGFDRWTVEGPTLTLFSGDAVPHVPRPGIQVDGLTCELAERAEGTNPFTLVRRPRVSPAEEPPAPTPCRVQVTLQGHTFTIDTSL